MSGNGNGRGRHAEIIDRPDHAAIARWILLGDAVDYDRANTHTLATLAAAHALVAVADAIDEATRAAVSWSRGMEDD